MSNPREQLARVVNENYVQTGENVKLSSGLRSKWFADIGRLLRNGAHMDTVDAAISLSLHEEGWRFEQVGGEQSGADQVSAAIMRVRRCTPINTFGIRKEMKFHGGDEGLIDGEISEGRILIVDDVSTSGKSIERTFDTVNKEITDKGILGARVVAAFCILDRSEGITHQRCRELGIDYASVLTEQDIVLPFNSQS